MCQRFRALYLYNSYFFDVCKVFFGKIICFARLNGGQIPTKRGRCREKKKLAGFVRGPAGHPEEQPREKPEICRGFTRRSSPRPAVRLGREVLRPSPRPAPGRCPPIRKRLWSGCVSSRYTRPQAKRGEEICRNLPSCKLHLDFRRRIRYNIYVIHTAEYAGVSEWQTRGTQNPLC